MNFDRTLLSSDVIEKFKCVQCQNYLYFFPVHIIGSDENICGRCEVPKGVNYFRNKIYEHFAQYIKFPCRYKNEGCCKELIPMDMISHEETCFFKPVKCPGFEFICDWEGCRSAVLSHCRDIHKDKFLNDKTFDLDSSCNSYLKMFIEYDGTLFLISINYDNESNVMDCSVYHAVEDTDENNNHSFQLILSKEDVSIVKQCSTSSFAEKEKYEISLDGLKLSSDEGSSIKIIGNIVFEKTVDDVVSARKRVNGDLLSLLKCSECEYFALPPIYQCEDKVKCLKCFGTDIPEGRNYSLDKIAELLDYPCEYRNEGCDIILKSEKMKKHLLVCPFENYNCPISYCIWSGLRKDLNTHIETDHGDILTGNGDLNAVSLGDCYKECIINIGGYLFMLIFCESPSANTKTKISTTFYKWAVFTIGFIEEKFKYEIEIKDFESDNRLLFPKENCSVLHETLSPKSEKYCYCSKGQINSLLGSKFITFRAHIFKE